MMYNILLMEDTNIKVQPTDNIPKILEDIHDNINIIIEEKNEPKIINLGEKNIEKNIIKNDKPLISIQNPVAAMLRKKDKHSFMHSIMWNNSQTTMTNKKRVKSIICAGKPKYEFKPFNPDNLTPSPWYNPTRKQPNMDLRNFPVSSFELDKLPKNNKDIQFQETLEKLILNVKNNEWTNVEQIINQMQSQTTKKVIEHKYMNLIIFEDDTFRAVIQIPEKNMDIIEGWYEKCNQVIEIEDINMTIPEQIEEKDLTPILFKNISCEHKNIFVKSYIPDIFNSLLTMGKIYNLENKMSIKTKYTDNKIKDLDIPSIEKLNIVIPSNMHYTNKYYYKKDNKIVSIDKYVKKMKPYTTKSSGNKHSLKDNKYYFSIEKNKDSLSDEEASLSDEEDSLPDYIEVKGSYMPPLDDIDGGVKSYNYDYDVLKPLFGSNCQEICPIDTEKIDKEKLEKEKFKNDKLIIVLFNSIINQSIVVIDPDLITLETIHECNGYGFLELFTIDSNNSELEELIIKHYDKICFNNIKELNNTLLSTSKVINLIKNRQDSKFLLEETSVKNFINTRYEITDNNDCKIKASVLYDIIIKTDSCKIDVKLQSGFKNRLRGYLKDLGFQKKLCNDGYYYFGIIDKYDDKNLDHTLNNSIYTHNKKIDFKEFINERDKETKEIITKLDWKKDNYVSDI